MKIVIDIPRKYYKDFKLQLPALNKEAPSEFAKYAIATGAPLPKGHGDLKDADEIKEFYRKKLVSNLVDEARGLDWSEYAELPCKVFNEVINNVPTIIEAESEDKE